MTPRVWIYSQMTGHAPLTALVGSRIHASTSLKAAPHVKPFIFYRSTSDIPDFRGDDGDVTRTGGVMIFCHDNAGDYMRIDTMIEALKTLFQDTSDQSQNIIRCTWIETSEDYRDEDMGTIFRWARVQIKYKV